MNIKSENLESYASLVVMIIHIYQLLKGQCTVRRLWCVVHSEAKRESKINAMHFAVSRSQKAV